jgi:hypothetical protein
MKRSPSAGMGFEPNRNTEWLDDRFFFVYYAILVLFVALIYCTTLHTRHNLHCCGVHMSSTSMPGCSLILSVHCLLPVPALLQIA